jgi:hypothetical protein
MRRLCELAACVAIAGCNPVFGLERTTLYDAATDDGRVPPDRDRDGIIDRDDPCIASIADYKSDPEGDGNPSETDACPFDYESTDSDGDNIYDECDPLWMVGGDRRRCFMGFSNPTITRELWQPRGDPAAWDLLAFNAIVANTTGTLVAAESFEAPVTTSYHANIGIMPPTTTGEVAFTLWVRTGEVAAGSDVGCELRGNSAMTRLTVKGSEPPVVVTQPDSIATAMRLQATISPGSSPGTKNVRCAAHFIGMVFPPLDASAAIALPPGHVAFEVDGTRARIYGLLVIERDDAPAL